MIGSSRPQYLSVITETYHFCKLRCPVAIAVLQKEVKQMCTVSCEQIAMLWHSVATVNIFLLVTDRKSEDLMISVNPGNVVGLLASRGLRDTCGNYNKLTKIENRFLELSVSV
jgi:hypothetical protein